MTTQFSANIMQATAVEANAIADLEDRLADAQEAAVQAELATQEAVAEAALLRAERDELSRLAGQLLTNLRTARAVAVGMLQARQLEVAAVRDLLSHLAVSTAPHDRLQRRLIANAYEAMGAGTEAAAVVSGAAVRVSA
jgi:hypothetical protein